MNPNVLLVVSKSLDEEKIRALPHILQFYGWILEMLRFR
jgi:hypothetical protein